MKKNLKILAREWFQKADIDFELALHLSKERIFPSPACFHSHQAAEKYLKGFLIYHGKDIRDEFKIHDLVKLYQYTRECDQNLSDEIKDACFTLNKYYITTRYPADMPEYSLKEVRQAVEAA